MVDLGLHGGSILRVTFLLPTLLLATSGCTWLGSGMAWSDKAAPFLIFNLKSALFIASRDTDERWGDTLLVLSDATAHHQTFTVPDDLDRRYFQVVPAGLYTLIPDVLGSVGLPVDPAAYQVVTTWADPSAVKTAELDAFLDRSDAGLVVGASATITPDRGSRLDFNKVVLPHPTQTSTTTDGEVLWLNLDPDGADALDAEDSQGRFQFLQVDMTCASGRLINASPTWGLTEVP